MRDLPSDFFSRAGVLQLAQTLGFAAEPLPLHPVGDVASVEHLGQRGTLRCLLIVIDDCAVAQLHRAARAVRSAYGGELQLFLFAVADYGRVVIGAFNAEQLATVSLERGRVQQADLDVLRELLPLNDEAGLALSLRHTRALDRLRVGNRFFADFRAQRARVAEALEGLPPRLTAERGQLALLLLSRLMFLYFLQRRGLLAGNNEYFARALRRHFSTPHRISFYRGVLRPLFFGVLNRRPEKRTRRAAALGCMPYLNGGLFERHALERRFAELDLHDDVMRGCFEHLLERYRFTAAEGEHELAVDPEMLGRVFEGLMAEHVRETTGTFYTPAPVVDRMVRSAFAAHLGQYAPHQATRVLRDVRVLDPACGSGAFLLSALDYIAEQQNGQSREETKRDVVARNLHGVDIQADAALLCALRLWLRLLPDSADAAVQPLPNLDRRIRQGDALIDPLDLAADAVVSRGVRTARRALQPLVQKYTTCDPEERQGVHRLLVRRERALAHAWIADVRTRIAHEQRELRAQAAARDLFGEVPESALSARVSLRLLGQRSVELLRVQRKLREHDALPFFSFNVHFADAERTGFDIILCNPPWVRTHNWPKHLGAALRKRFVVCREGGQVDLALVFLERALSLLAPGGTLAIILPAKFLRSASAGAARKLLLEQTDLIALEDHSLDQKSIFQADAFAAIVIARKKSALPAVPVQVTMVRRGVAPLRFGVSPDSLRFVADDPRAVWMLAPRHVCVALNQMRESGTALSQLFTINRGLVTGANGVLVVPDANAKIGDLAQIRSENGTEALVEESVLHPLVRGCDVAAWHADVSQKLIYCRTPPTRTQRYMRKHLPEGFSTRFDARFVNVDPKRARVAWHDLAANLNAVVLPVTMPCFGVPRPLIPLNTVYYIDADCADAMLLAAYFNSLPVRVFARVIAERAKDAHFRFFAHTMAQVPLPSAWRRHHADGLRSIAQTAHKRSGIDASTQQQLDELVAQAYGLSGAALNALRRFDRWLAGEQS